MPKENDGRSSRRRTWGRIMFALAGGVVTIGAVVFLSLGRKTTDVVRGRSQQSPLAFTGVRHRLRSPLSSSVSSSPENLAILRGEYTLINLRTGISSLQATAGSTDYTGVLGSFCRINWALQAQNPAKIPMFRDLQASSYDCHEVIRDLGYIVRKMRQYDVDHPDDVVSVPPTAVVFHETRCGSTLVANLLAAAKPNNQHMVYSESPPPLAALQACEGEKKCDPAKHIQLIQDVFYVMGRRQRQQQNHEEFRVFYKIQSVGSHRIGAFAKAMPTTPWFFIFRDSIEVMMSHVDPSQRLVQRWAVCLRSRYGEPKPVLSELVKEKGKSVSSLSSEQFCAAHLASLCLSALKEYESQSPSAGHFINYQQLPDIIWDSILPNLLNVPLSSEDVERMKRVAGVYSKGRFDLESWEQDSQKKRKESPTAVREAASEFMNDVYERLQQLKE